MRILFVTHLPPYPSISGGRQRTAVLYEALCAIGEVDLLVATGWSASEDPWGAEFNKVPRARWIAMPGYSDGQVQRGMRTGFSAIVGHARSATKEYAVCPEAARRVHAILQNGSYDAIVVRYFRTVCSLDLWSWRPIVDIDDFEGDYDLSRARAPAMGVLMRLLLRRRAAALRTLLQRHIGLARHAWVTRESDRGRLANVRVTVLPNCWGSSPDAARPPVASQNSLLFVGALVWPPNRDGLGWFIDHVWPRIVAHNPMCRLDIVGAGLAPPLQRRFEKIRGIILHGRVDSLEEYYHACSAVVVPTWYGAGTHVKIAESYGYGRCCVVTPVAHRGYETVLRRDAEILVADAAEPFAQACLDLLRDAAKRSRFAANGRARLAESASVDKFRDVVRATLEVESRMGEALIPAE